MILDGDINVRSHLACSDIDRDAAETTVDQVEPATVHEKRAAAHERGRAAVDEMRAPTEG